MMTNLNGASSMDVTDEIIIMNKNLQKKILTNLVAVVIILFDPL